MNVNKDHLKIKFSIVIPVYNAELYLERCLHSLFVQDMRAEEYEIIAINDGSQDESGIILERESRLHSNLIYIKTDNHGVSEARNYGCHLARGKYLLFVDADDCIQENSLQRIYHFLEVSNLDVLVLDYIYRDETGELPPFIRYAPTQMQDAVMPGKEFMLSCLPQVVWCSVYRMDFWREYSFRFLPIRHEDEEIIPRIFYYAKRVQYQPLKFYNYYKNSNSFMMNYNADACFALIQGMQSLDGFRQRVVTEKKVNVFLKELISRRLLAMIIYGIRLGLSSKELMLVCQKMKEYDFAPLPPGKKGLHAFLYRYFPAAFIAYYRLKKWRK